MLSILGIFTYLKGRVRENFSKDLTPEVLEVLVDIFKVRKVSIIIKSLTFLNYTFSVNARWPTLIHANSPICNQSSSGNHIGFIHDCRCKPMNVVWTGTCASLIKKMLNATIYWREKLHRWAKKEIQHLITLIIQSCPKLQNHLRCIFFLKLSGRYEALKDSMSEAASIPPSWCTLAEVMPISKTNTKQYL